MLLLVAGRAQALLTTLETELDTGLTGAFATVEVTERAGALDFTIALDPSLGPDADLHAFYFNLVDDGLTGLDVLTRDPVANDYVLEANPSVNGGAGSTFDYGVSFGDGAGPSGNGTLQIANFTVFADQTLTLAQLDEISRARGGLIDLHFVLHAQSTSLMPRADSEAVGGALILPEPSAGLLLTLGLTGLALRSRASPG
jgi:hypothetical protein